MDKGNLAKITDFDNLFLRIKTVRDNHANASAQLGTLPSMPSSSSINVGSEINTNPIQQLKNELSQLTASKWYKSNTAATIVTMPDFSTTVNIPSVGSLISATDFDNIENAIVNAENASVPTYSSQYSQYSQYGQYGQYGQYSQYNQYANYGSQYSKYSQYSQYSKYNQYSNYSVQYAKYGQYSNYSSQYGRFTYTGAS